MTLQFKTRKVLEFFKHSHKYLYLLHPKIQVETKPAICHMSILLINPWSG